MAMIKLFKLFKNSFQTISAPFLRTKAVDYFGAWKDVGTSISGYYLKQILALVGALLTSSGPSHHAVCKVAQGGHRHNRVLFAGAQLVEDKKWTPGVRGLWPSALGYLFVVGLALGLQRIEEHLAAQVVSGRAAIPVAGGL